MDFPGNLRGSRPAYSPAQDKAERENARIGREFPGVGDVIMRQRARYDGELAAGRLALEDIRALEHDDPAMLPEGTTEDAEAGLYPLADFPIKEIN